MNTVAESETKSLPLSEYISRMKNLGFEDDQIQGMINSLVKRGIIAIESDKSMVKFDRGEKLCG